MGRANGWRAFYCRGECAAAWAARRRPVWRRGGFRRSRRGGGCEGRLWALVELVLSRRSCRDVDGQDSQAKESKLNLKIIPSTDDNK